MFNGNTRHVLDFLSGQGKGRLLHLSEIVYTKNKTTMRDVLEGKHPPSAPPFYEFLNTTASDPSWFSTLSYLMH